MNAMDWNIPTPNFTSFLELLQALSTARALGLAASPEASAAREKAEQSLKRYLFALSHAAAGKPISQTDVLAAFRAWGEAAKGAPYHLLQDANRYVASLEALFASPQALQAAREELAITPAEIAAGILG